MEDKDGRGTGGRKMNNMESFNGRGNIFMMKRETGKRGENTSEKNAGMKDDFYLRLSSSTHLRCHEWVLQGH